jgi:myo-inositol 2-dehydrogenase / D-chiro-inositol 1-dehydrogenase
MASSSISRRSFLKKSQATAAAVSLASAATQVHAAGSDEIKLALVGCGNRGTGAIVNALQVKQNVTLHAMADAFEDRINQSLDALLSDQPSRKEQTDKQLSKRVDVPPDRRFVGLDAYKQAIDAADVAVITGPPGFRPDHFEYAVSQGKHVFMEKPVATDAPGIRRVLATAELAKQKGLKVGVGLQRHHEAKYIETIGRLHDGAIGDIKMLRCYWNGGTIKVPVPHDGLTEMEYQVRNWYFFAWLSGDHNVEQHVHNLDVCNWVKKAHPVSAMGVGGRQMRTGKDYGDIFDHHAVEYTYPDGMRMFSVCRQMPGCEPLIGEYAVGTLGEADISNATIKSSTGDWKFPKVAGGSKANNAYQIEHDHLFEAIAKDLPYNEAETGAIATMTAILGRLATYTGRTVRWEEAFQSEKSLAPEKWVGWNTIPKTLPNAEGRYPLPQPGLIQDV